MSATDTEVEDPLLKVAKALLIASGELAGTDPEGAAKLAQEAYDIAHELDIERHHLEEAIGIGVELDEIMPAMTEPADLDLDEPLDLDLNLDREAAPTVDREPVRTNVELKPSKMTKVEERVTEEEGDDGLYRILDRQRDVVPKLTELLPTDEPMNRSEEMRFEVSSSPSPRRSGWFSWMRSREISHAG